ncbi:MAG: efflux RND transporter permease subunit [Planctomycetes bacterium]|nr:efflux RND transporter permease subunit [Planctomycetota bacterium]
MATSSQKSLIGVGLALLIGAGVTVYFLNSQPIPRPPEQKDDDLPKESIRHERVVTYTYPFPGASAAEADQEVALLLSKNFHEIAKLRSVCSRASDGKVVFELAFDPKEDAARMAMQIQEVAAKSSAALPMLSGPGVYDDYPPNALPVVWLALESELLSLGEIKAQFEAVVRPKLQAIPGVGKMDLVGDSPPEIKVQLDPQRLAKLGIPPKSVITAVAKSREKSKPKGNASLEDIVVGERNGAPIRLKDVAEIKDDFTSCGFALYLRRRVLAVGIHVKPNADAAKMGTSLREALPAIRQGLKEGTKLTIAIDSTRSGDEFLVEFRFPDKTTLGEIDRAVASFEERYIPDPPLEENRRIGPPLVLYSADTPTKARVLIPFEIPHDLERAQVLKTMRETGNRLPGATFRMIDLSGRPLPRQQTYPIRVSLVEDNSQKLSNWINEVTAKCLKENDVLIDVDTEPLWTSTTTIQLDRESAARAGVSAEDFTLFVSMLHGYKVGEFNFLIRDADLSRLDLIGNIPLPGADGTSFPMKNVARIEVKTTPTIVERLNGRRCVTINTNPAPEISIGTARNRLKAIAEETRTTLGLGEAKVASD